MGSKMTTFRFMRSTIILTLVLIGGQVLADRSARADKPLTVMSGDYSAVVVTRFVDKDLVRSWLPSGLELAEDHWALSRDQIESFVMPASLDLPLGRDLRA